MSLPQAICILLALLAAVPQGTAKAPLTSAEQTLLKVLDTGEVKADLTLIPPEQKEAVVSRLREIAQQKEGSVEVGNALVHVSTADLLLLRLGDTFTMDRMMRDYRAYNSMSSWGYAQNMFEYSQQPLLIPYLAQDLYLEEDPSKGITVAPPPDSDEFAVTVPPRSIFSGVTMVRIIEKSPAFSEAMKAWTKQAYALRRESASRFRSLMQAFWERNKEAFDRKDYGAVVPVAENQIVPAKPPAPRTPPPSVATPSPMVAVAPPSTPFLEIAKPSQVVWRVPAWQWGGVAIATGLVLVMIFKRRPL